VHELWEHEWVLVKMRQGVGHNLGGAVIDSRSIRKVRNKFVARFLKPGEIAPASGEYEIIGPRGGQTRKERTVPKGKPLPPTPGPDERYKLVRRAHNRSGHGRPRSR
jgi:hypothetical protein